MLEAEKLAAGAGITGLKTGENGGAESGSAEKHGGKLSSSKSKQAHKSKTHEKSVSHMIDGE